MLRLRESSPQQLINGVRHLAKRYGENIEDRVNWFRVMRTVPLSSRISWQTKLTGINIYIGEEVDIDGHVYIRSALVDPDNEYVKIGNHCHLRSGTQIHSWCGFVEIGNHCSINPNTVMYGTGGIRIGNYVRIAANTIIIASMHKFDRLDTPIRCQGYTAEGITIEDDVWIGANASILDGVKIGCGSVVGAGAVVNKDVQPYSVVVGVPAKVIRYRK